MLSRVLVSIASVLLGSALRVQHETHNNLANQTALSLHQKEQKAKLGSKLNPCTTSISTQVPTTFANSNFPRLATSKSLGAATSFGCPWEAWEEQAPFYLDMASTNVMSARSWWNDELRDDDKSRWLKTMGFGDTTNYSLATKEMMNHVFSKANNELKILFSNSLPNGKGNALELIANISSNSYNTKVQEDLKPGQALSRSEVDTFDYEKCMFVYAELGRTLGETLKCLAKVGPPDMIRHRHVHGSSANTPYHSMGNHLQAFLKR